MWQRLGRFALAMTVVLAGAALGEDDTALLPLFDGRSLDGWICEHTDGFRVRDGVIVNAGGTGWLRHHKSYRDFELHAEYRAMKRGADSGLLFRASAESAARSPHLPVKGLPAPDRRLQEEPLRDPWLRSRPPPSSTGARRPWTR